jgi:cell division protein FtsA
MSKNFKKGKIVACLDMGSSKLVCTIASVTNEGVEVLGYGHKASRGIMASAISDMRLAQKAITSVVSEAERMAGFNIERLLVGLSGHQVTSTHKDVSTKISSDIVKNNDIAALATKVREEYKKNNREIIHLIPLQYSIDDSLPVVNPRYMSGENLHAKFHVVSTSQTTIRNIENCLKRCQLSVDSYIVEPYASALSCLSEKEMDLGCLMIDIGGSSTSFCVLIEGKLVYVGSSPMGGIHITKDIAVVLNTNFDVAEKIKSLNGSLLISPIEERELIKRRINDVEDGATNINISRIELCQIIRSRVEEIFESVKSVLDKAGIPFYMLGNIALSGGVTSIVGIDKVASEIFGKNVRIGYPHNLEGVPQEVLNPTNSCSIGMLLFLRNLHLKEKIKDSFQTRTSWFRNIIEKIASV